jgi:hypothetical protein
MAVCASCGVAFGQTESGYLRIDCNIFIYIILPLTLSSLPVASLFLSPSLLPLRLILFATSRQRSCQRPDLPQRLLQVQIL